MSICCQSELVWVAVLDERGRLNLAQTSAEIQQVSSNLMVRSGVLGQPMIVE